jgi:uncharacterized protein YegL
VENVTCNAEPCPFDIKCGSKLDVVILMDGSGSVGWWGFEAERVFIQELIGRMRMGEESAQVALVLFSEEVEIEEGLTYDKAALLDKVANIAWPGITTNTAGALAKALTVLTMGSRDDASNLVFVITDGMPNDRWMTGEAAEEVKKSSRLIFVPVGPYLDLSRVNQWATDPPSENVLNADSFYNLDSELTRIISDMCPVLEMSVELDGYNDGSATDLAACIGECDADSQCATGLKCFQRTYGNPIPGCTGEGSGRDWDYCYDPTGSIELSGSNNGWATGLSACVGECDGDWQCATGLKCFQRSNGETIPGCTGDGAGRDWDYCYDPFWVNSA